jgi:hypothetical protein
MSAVAMVDNPLTKSESRPFPLEKQPSKHHVVFSKDRETLKEWTKFEGLPYYSFFGLKIYNAMHPIARYQHKVGGLP